MLQACDRVLEDTVGKTMRKWTVVELSSDLLKLTKQRN